MEKHLFTNGSVLTMQEEGRIFEACAVSGDKILGVGDVKEMKDLLGPGFVEIDMKSGVLTPGFVDCHHHFILTSYFKMNLDLIGVASIDELLSVIKERTANEPSGKWVLGLRFREDDYPEKRMPTLAELDSVSRNNPVFLLRYDGHSAMANSKALEAAGITVDTPDPEGGVIDRNNSGLTGIVREMAVSLLFSAAPIPEIEEFRKGKEILTQKLLSYGITGIHNILMTADDGMSGALGPYEVPAFKLFEPEIPFFTYPLIAASTVEDAIRLLTENFGVKKEDGLWRGGALKLFADGTFGSRTAFFYEDYNDLAGEKGFMVSSVEQLESIILKACEEGLQTAVHAIGDRAVSELIRIYFKAEEKYPGKNLRHRIEHASMIRPEDHRGIKAAGLICSFQPTFILSEGAWIEDRVGDRLKNVYPIKSILKKGIPACGGSDSPIEEPDVLAGVYAAVTRKGFTPDQALTPYEALGLYTTGAAYASFTEKTRGTIAPGKHADLTMLSQNPLEINTEDIPGIEVLTTMINGKPVYRKGN